MSNEAFTTIYIARHGQSEGNVLDAQQGHLNFPLTGKGLQQASNLAVALEDIQFDEIHASDLARAYETANVIAQLREMSVKSTPALRERNFGQLEGKIKGEMPEQTTALEYWNKLPDDQWLAHKIVQDSETGNEMLARFFEYLEGVVKDGVGKTVLFVSHQGMMRNILVALGWGTNQQLRGNTIENTGYIKMLVDQRKAEKERYAIVDTSGIRKRDMDGELI